MIINRVWAMPNRWTFSIKPIKELLDKYAKDGIGWLDPFAGKFSPAEITNDLNPKLNTMYHLDAREFLKLFPDNYANGILFDPPYSPRQVMECYNGIGKKVTAEETKASFWSRIKNEMARIIKPNGLAICFGWNSMGLGKKRGFEMIEILLVAHGGNKNDTIVTVEKKIQINI